MTERGSFERLVHTRMQKTGQSFTAARASLLAAKDGESEGDAPVLPLSDEAVRRRTGRGWEQWFDLLDGWGAGNRGHKEIASWLAEEHAVDAWSAQSVTVAFERAHRGRAVGERPEGFEVSATKTVAVPVEALFDAFVDDALRARWLPDGELRQRTASRPKSARFDWGDGTSRVNVGFTARGDAKSVVALQHERLPDASEAGRMKAYWRERVAALKEELER